MATIKVNRPCDVVWNIFTDLNSWTVWWGGTLKRINPSWQVGATLEWEAGDEGQVLDFNPLKRTAYSQTARSVLICIQRHLNSNIFFVVIGIKLAAAEADR